MRLNPISVRNTDTGVARETDVKILLPAIALVSCLGLLLTDWASQAFTYL